MDIEQRLIEELSTIEENTKDNEEIQTALQEMKILLFGN